MQGEGESTCLAHGDRILGLLAGGRPADPRDLCKPKLVEKDRLLSVCWLESSRAL